MTRVLPPLRRSAADAEAYARVVHAGQVDQAGRPYVEHLGRVFQNLHKSACPGVSLEDLRIAGQIAWLHDVIEDTGRTAEDLRAEGFAPAVTGGMEMLTKRGSAPYIAWIEQLCASAPLPVLLVKLADMEDNSDPARLALLPAETRVRLERKYGPAIVMLRAAVERAAS